jgi:hypothetical protein
VGKANILSLSSRTVASAFVTSDDNGSKPMADVTGVTGAPVDNGTSLPTDVTGATTGAAYGAGAGADFAAATAATATAAAADAAASFCPAIEMFDCTMLMLGTQQWLVLNLPAQSLSRVANSSFVSACVWRESVWTPIVSSRASMGSVTTV